MSAKPSISVNDPIDPRRTFCTSVHELCALSQELPWDIGDLIELARHGCKDRDELVV